MKSALSIFTLLVLNAASSVPARAQNTSTAGLAMTPPMGWNSWNKFASNINDVTIRAQADAMVASGMKAAGYEYVNIDAGWEGVRDAHGILHPNKNFPDMKALAAYIHGKGLKIGIYSSPGPKACGGFEGSYGHEEQDAKLFVSWEMDYLKYDWCTAGTMYQRSQYPEALRKMSVALARLGRPVVYSIHGRGAVWEYAAAQGANLWRTTGDIEDTYARMLAIGFAQEGLEKFAGPGHWNDPDMLEIGNGGMKDNEYRMHMSLWCLLAAPLITGNDLTTMTPTTLAILTNPEVIAVDQDSAGIQGHRIKEEGPIAILMKPLKDGSKAVGFFNREQGVVTVEVKFSDIGLPGDASVRDLWERKDLGRFQGSFSVDVPEHGVVLVFAALALAGPSQSPEYFEYFLNHAHHKAGIPLDMITFHFYANPAEDETPEVQQYTFFDQADHFLDTVRYVNTMRARLSPETQIDINEQGSIEADDNRSGPILIPNSYWNLSGALYAYVYGELASLGIEYDGEIAACRLPHAISVGVPGGLGNGAAQCPLLGAQTDS